jgi:hypothetical protein
LQSTGHGQRECGVEGGFGDADLFIGGCDLALGLGNIGAPFQ